MTSRRLPVTLLVVAATTIGGLACGAKSPSTTPPTAPPSTQQSSTSTSPSGTVGSTSTAPSTTELATSTTEESDVVCGALAPLPQSAREISSSVVDWDGSGVRDTAVLVYETAPDTADYRLRVERDSRGSEFAIIMTNPVDAPSSGAPVSGEPAFVSPVQVDGTASGPSPEELLVRVGLVEGRLLNGVRQSSGYDLAVFRNDGNGCLSRFRNAMDVELTLPIRAGGPEVSGLVCVSDSSSPGITEFLTRTSATRITGSNPAEYRTHDIELRTVSLLGVPSGASPDQLVDGPDTQGRVGSDGLLRYSSITGCNLNGADGGGSLDDPVSTGEDQIDDGVGD